MRGVPIVVLFVIVTVGALAAAILLLPFLKEGFGSEELPIFAGTTAVLFALGVLWWFVHRGSNGLLYRFGLAVLAVPLCAHAFLCVRVIANDWRGKRLAPTVRVVSLRESEIRWPGLAEPIGLRMELELEHAIGLQGNLYPPKIVMGVDPRPDYRDYIFGPMDRGVDATLEANIYQPGDPETPRDVVLRPGRAHLSFELFPSRLQRRDGNALCLRDPAGGSPDPRPGIAEGTNLGAAWFFAAFGGVVVDMSGPLTQALRRWSTLQGRADEWRRLINRLEPAALEGRGFRRCAPSRPGSFETCYCAPESAQP